MTTMEEFPILLSVTLEEALGLLGMESIDLVFDLANPHSFGKVNNRAYLRLEGIKTWTKKKARKDLIAILCEDDWDEMEEI